jgi:hypothetical protein
VGAAEHALVTSVLSTCESRHGPVYRAHRCGPKRCGPGVDRSTGVDRTGRTGVARVQGAQVWPETESTGPAGSGPSPPPGLPSSRRRLPQARPARVDGLGRRPIHDGPGRRRTRPDCSQDAIRIRCMQQRSSVGVLRTLPVIHACALYFLCAS